MARRPDYWRPGLPGSLMFGPSGGSEEVPAPQYGLLGEDAVRKARNAALLKGGLALLRGSSWSGYRNPGFAGMLADGVEAGMGAYEQSMAQSEQEAQQERVRQILADPTLRQGMTPAQIRLLDAMPLSGQMEILGQRAFAGGPEPVKLGAKDRLVAPGPDGRYRELVGAAAEGPDYSSELRDFLGIIGLSEGQMAALSPQDRAALLQGFQTFRRSRAANISMGGEADPAVAHLSDIGREAYTAATSRGQTAMDTLVQLDEMEALLETTPTGAWEQMALPVRQMLAGMGVEVPEGTPRQEALRALANSMTLDLTMKLSGQISNYEIDFLKKSIPNLGLLPEGNQIILSTMRRKAEFDLKYAAEARRYVAETRDLAGLEAHMAQWAAENRPKMDDLIEEYTSLVPEAEWSN